MTHGAKRSAAYLALAIATAAAIGLGIANSRDVTNVQRDVVRIGTPCVDANGKEKGIVPSKGCKRYYRLIAQLCADNPKFCRESQRLALAQTQNEAVQRLIGNKPSSSIPDVLPEGGSGLRIPKRDRQGNGNGDSVEPNPNNPNNNPNQPTPDNSNPDGGGGGGNNGGGNNNGGQSEAPPAVDVQTDPPRIKVDPPPVVLPIIPKIDLPPTCVDLNLLQPGIQC